MKYIDVMTYVKISRAQAACVVHACFQLLMLAVYHQMGGSPSDQMKMPLAQLAVGHRDQTCVWGS